jgi:hypothetical protein
MSRVAVFLLVVEECLGLEIDTFIFRATFLWIRLQ